MASLPYPRTPLFPRLHPSFPTLAPLFLSLHALLFPFHPISFPLHTPYFCHPHRPTQMLVSTDADIRTDRRRCSYRSARMTFVDVSLCQTFTFVLSNLYFRAAKPLLSQCQTVTFVLPNRYFCAAKPLLSCCQTVAFAVQNLPFHISLPLFLAISSPVFLNQRCFHVVCILWLQSLKQPLSCIIL